MQHCDALEPRRGPLVLLAAAIRVAQVEVQLEKWKHPQVRLIETAGPMFAALFETLPPRRFEASRDAWEQEWCVFQGTLGRVYRGKGE